MMSDVITRTLHNVIEAMEGAGIEYAVFGGLAVQAWKRLRSTLDIDVMVLIKEGKGLNLVTDTMLKQGLKPAPGKQKVQLGDITLLRFVYPDEASSLDIKVDIAVASSGFPQKVVSRGVKLNIAGKDMFLARCEDVILLKVLSDRPIDAIDAKELYAINKEIIDKRYIHETAKELGLSKRLQELESK